MPKLTSFVVGLLLLIAGMIGSLLLAGHSPAILFNLPPALAILLIPIGCCTIAFGVRGPISVLQSFAGLRSAGPAEVQEAMRVIAACIGYVYGAGVFVLLASLLSIMACLSEVVAFGLTQHFGETIVAIIASLLYPVVIAEFVLRPLKHRLAARADA
jgi:hypothetical protein